MTLARRVAFATGVQVAGRAFALVFSLLAVKLTTNYLGLDGYGSYAVVLAGSGLVFAVADLGLPMLLARELAKHPDRTDEIAGGLLSLRLVSCAAILALTAVVTPLLPYTTEERVGLLLATAGFMVGTVSLFPIPFFQVHMRLDLAALAEVFARGASLALLGTVALLDLGFLAVVSTIGLAWAANLVFTFTLSRRFWHVSLHGGLRGAWRNLRPVAPIALVGVLGLLHFKIDALLLSFLQPAADVGIYMLAYSVFEQGLFLPALFMAAVFPILTRFLHAHDLTASRDVLDKSVRFLVALGLIVGALLFTLAVPLVRLLSNADFADAAGVLRILSFAVLPLYAAAAFGGLLVSLADLRLLAGASLLGIVVNVVLNLALIPRYSYDAAAGVTVFSETLGFVLIFAIARRRAGFDVRPRRWERLLLVATATVALTLASAALPWWAAAPVVLCGSLGLAILLRVVSRDELRLVLRGDAGVA